MEEEKDRWMHRYIIVLLYVLHIGCNKNNNPLLLCMYFQIKGVMAQVLTCLI